VTGARHRRTRVLHIGGWQLLAAALLGAALLLALAGGAYQLLAGPDARGDGGTLPGGALRPASSEEAVRRDRYLRENLDAMATKLGALQAKLLRLDAVGARVSHLAGLKPEDLTALDRADAAAAPASSVRTAPGPSGRAPLAASAGEGGPYWPVASPSLAQLDAALDAIAAGADQRSDVFTLAESRLLESRLHALMLPSAAPVEGPVGSGFGFRTDPFTGRAALHTGLDFPAAPGTPVEAAAGGVVRAAESHPAYGLMVEIDHGDALVTRYAHASRLLVRPGDIVRRGQPVATVGSTGRSTGPHLHFEVLLGGVPQNPARFLARDGAARLAAR
jgi:murein DD-endopeptidase MepM/ murein hydrolase activator NlpD